MLIDDIGLDELSKMVVNPLRGLKVAPFYGCHIIRPESVNGWESSRNPHSLEDLIHGARRRTGRLRGKTRCCGFHVQLEKEGIAPNMVGQKHAHGEGQRRGSRSDAVPALPLALDGYQADSAARWGRTDLPTFHLPQLVALALGVDATKLGLKRHVISPGPVLQAHDLAPMHGRLSSALRRA